MASLPVTDYAGSQGGPCGAEGRERMAEQEQRLLMAIDDEPAQSRLITALASREGWRTLVVNDSETAIATLGTREGMQLAAIILDQWVPGDDACTLIAELKSRRPGLPILMLTTSASPLLAVEALSSTGLPPRVRLRFRLRLRDGRLSPERSERPPRSSRSERGFAGAGSTIRPLVPGGIPWSWKRCSEVE